MATEQTERWVKVEHVDYSHDKPGDPTWLVIDEARPGDHIDQEVCQVWKEDDADLIVSLKSRLAAAEEKAARLTELIERLKDERNGKIISGSIGPLMDVGYATAWQSVRNIIADALSPARGGGE